MTHAHKRSLLLLAALLGAGLCVGCKASPAGLAMSIVGKVVNDADVKAREEQFIGRAAAEATRELGDPIETYQEVGGRRIWDVYGVPKDVLKLHRYVIESRGGVITAVAKTKKYSDVAMDAAMMAAYRSKVIGKSPDVCRQELDMGPPQLTVQSTKTGLWTQLYDARIVKKVQSPYYCILRFDANRLCNKMEMVEVVASSREDGL